MGQKYLMQDGMAIEESAGGGGKMRANRTTISYHHLCSRDRVSLNTSVCT